MRDQKYESFYNYLLELCEEYHNNKNSRGISLIARKYKIGALTNAQFYDVFKLANPELHPEDFEENSYLPTKEFAKSVRDSVIKYYREQELLRKQASVKNNSNNIDSKELKVIITPVTSWIDALNCARFTQRKELIYTEPSDKFKRQIIRAEHSPLRALMFYIDMYNIPYYTAMHFRTHKLVHLPLVSTSRPDIDGNMKPREEQLKSELVNMRLMLDAQEIIAISRVRLCSRAETETRQVWHKVIEELNKIEPLLANACVPSCVYKGFCPEIKCCGFTQSIKFAESRNNYINSLTVAQYDGARYS